MFVQFYFLFQPFWAIILAPPLVLAATANHWRWWNQQLELFRERGWKACSLPLNFLYQRHHSLSLSLCSRILSLSLSGYLSRKPSFSLFLVLSQTHSLTLSLDFSISGVTEQQKGRGRGTFWKREREMRCLVRWGRGRGGEKNKRIKNYFNVLQ